MRTRLPLALLACAVAAISAAPASAATKKPIYVSLGDSLAWSYGKAADGRPTQSAKGYTELLAARARKTKRYGRRLTVKKFACPGESTASYLGVAPRGPIDCGFKKSQHADSIAFIKKNRKRIGFITVSIGANNFTPCSQGLSIDIPCIQRGNEALDAHLPRIFRDLRRAAGRRTPILAFNVYNPYLALYLQGPAYAQLALLTVDQARLISTKIEGAAARQKLKVGDVFSAFKVGETSKMTTLNGRAVPVAVAQNCVLTLMCRPAPVGPDIHPSDAGYRAMAAAAARALKVK